MGSQFAFTMLTSLPPPSDGLVYRFFLDLDPPFVGGPIDFKSADCRVELIGSTAGWTARHCGGTTTYEIDANKVFLFLPLSAIGNPTQFEWFGDTVDFSLPDECCRFDQIPTSVVNMADNL